MQCWCISNRTTDSKFQKFEKEYVYENVRNVAAFYHGLYVLTDAM